MRTAAVIGAGPAGLMAAEHLAQAGVQVVVADAKPSVARKFLMAGKSGLNLTKAESFDPFLSAFTEASGPMAPMLRAFGPEQIVDWATGLGQEVFVGSTGRVFPKAMKASPLLRAWLARLDELGAERRVRWRWTGWQDGKLQFDTPEGAQSLAADVTVLALGGGSWARLGSDGQWVDTLQARGVDVTPFRGANVGVQVTWSPRMEKVIGAPLKGITLKSGDQKTRGEAVISKQGLEGGGVYTISRAVQEQGDLRIDLLPGRTADQISAAIAKPRGKASFSNHLRKVLRLDSAKLALLTECAAPLSKFPEVLAQIIKDLPIPHQGPRPIDQAISTAGGVPFAALNAELMLTQMPGVFCAGEMLDWEAPTGGYLLSGCFATGRWAGMAAARWVTTRI